MSHTRTTKTNTTGLLLMAALFVCAVVLVASSTAGVAHPAPAAAASVDASAPTLPGAAAPGVPAVPDVPAGEVDLNAKVVSGGQCAACHARIAEGKKPGIIFSHGSHLLVSCDACHWAPPHQGGQTLGPTMDSCFNCHGVPHGDKLLARADCAACHTKSFVLRPQTHVKDWKGKPHADRAKLGENRCLMCHDPVKFCDDCHTKQNLNLPPSQAVYRSGLPDQPARPQVLVAPDGPTSMGQCVKCHPDLDSFMPGRVIFAHAQHLDKGFACTSCHKSFGHAPDVTYRPDMPTCYACHGLVHAARATVATTQCSACHPKEFQLVPKDHTAAFIAKDHKDASVKQPEMCGMCHEPTFCTACHQGQPKKTGAPARNKVIPADHKKRDFLYTHGPAYMGGGSACASCHDGATCVKCHKTPLPHPPDWTASHALATGLDSVDCNKCHKDREQCQQCHHQALKGVELVQENCVRCHSIMRTDPPTDIKNKGLAEHAVHFNVAKAKGRPYRCEDCHVTFGKTSISPGMALMKGHDLRLCYECHGALDYQNKLVAKYPGNQLCLRCHKNLSSL